jgi:hypothetical protein
VMEAIAKKLVGIAGVPSDEQAAMVCRAARAGRDVVQIEVHALRDQTRRQAAWIEGVEAERDAARRRLDKLEAATTTASE